MNEQTAAILGQLAAKLGTTSEYLWAILLKQAPIYAAISIIELALTVIVAVLLFKYRKEIGPRLMKFAEEAEVLGFIVIFVVGAFGFIWLISMVITLESSITAILNPDYWALKEILNAVKSK